MTPQPDPTEGAAVATGHGPEKNHQDDQHERGLSEDWAWRRRIRSDARLNSIYRAVVAILGLVVTVSGLVLVPAPGPGWLIVFAGIAIWASEFDWAKRLLDWGKARLKEWTAWIEPKPLWFKGLFGLATLILVLALFWVLFKVTGVPGFLPEFTTDFLAQYAHLG